MHELFLHERTYERIGSSLASYAGQMNISRLTDSGQMLDSSGGELKDLPEPSIIYGNTDAYFSPVVAEFMTVALKAPRLEWFQSSAAGIEHPVLQQIGAKAGAYTNSHAQSDAIAEWIVWAAMDWLQRGPERRQAQQDKLWQSLPWREIAETRWLIVGFGGIGQAAARRAKLLGAEVIGVRRSAQESDLADRVVMPDQIPSLLPDVDIVVMATPLTDETRHMADAAFFAAMKDNALYINVGRGGLNDETALLRGLEAGRPSYAYMDVFETEPLEHDSPFWHHPRVTLTAHLSAQTDAAKARTDQVFLKNLDLFLAGKPMTNLVPKSEFAV